MRWAVSGASGLVGSALCRALAARGDEVSRLVRRPARAPDEITWDPRTGVPDPSGLEGLDVVVHLAGRSIFALRWTPRVRAEIRDSRVEGTRTLVRALGGLAARPRRLLSASAIGYYGDRGDEKLTEESSAGEGFLAETAREWEAEAIAAEAHGIEVARLRLGVVLSREDGALRAMLPIFRLGLGGPVGGGRQFLSWIHQDDVVNAILHLGDPVVVTDGQAGGAHNLVAPQPDRQRDFARTLGRVLGRPALLPAPGWAVALAGGQMARETVLMSARVLPERLLASGFRHRHPELEGALQAELR